MQYPNVNREIVIKESVFKNRLVFPPIGTNYADNKGNFTPKLIRHYGKRIEGGVGCVEIEATSVSRDGKMTKNQLCAFADRFQAGLKNIIRDAHQNNVILMVQLAHGGRFSDKEAIGSLPLSPSPVTTGQGDITLEMSEEDCRRIQSDFIESAIKAYESGADGVELHMAHGYLLAQFLSPATNFRSDQYGGSIENRSRFAVEIINGIRQKADPKFLIWCRISAEEYTENGLELKDSVAIAQILSNNGVDCIHVSCGIKGAGKSSPYGKSNSGHIVYLSEEIKKNVNIPVVAVSKIITLEMAEDIISSRKADFVAIGRPLLADPMWFLKSLKKEESKECNYCNAGCLNNAVMGKEIKCVLWEDESDVSGSEFGK